ncbi:MAG: ATP-dependent 6-phosphofructokinase [Chromatiales bacterium]|nr:ATP-dependent 6-phosphofructokinase [Chromatiales bacterium]
MNFRQSFEIDQLGACRIDNPMASEGDFHFVDDRERLLCDPHLSGLEEAIQTGAQPNGFEVAGPRRLIHFEPERVRAAVVTCGGLSPGLNSVIRGLVMQLWYHYGCRDILGIRYGYNGLSPDAQPPLALTPERVSNIHLEGGTILGSSRGTPPTATLVDTLVALGIDVLFTVGGDGTMRGAAAIQRELHDRRLDIAVVGIPKTIDNDIPFVRRAFGFETAVAIATQSVRAAEVEAKGSPRGVGLVKLMGRHAGFIAATAALAAGNANLVLIPEVPFALDGLLRWLEERLERKNHVVIVAAEGAGQDCFDTETLGTDASGNQALGDIGVLLRDRIKQHFAEAGTPVTMKYIDPSYLIRSTPANPTDQIYCDRLARAAAHAAMAGKTGMLIGYWHGRMTHVPMQALEGQTRRVNPQGELWHAVLENTGQPARIDPPQDD